MGNIKSPYKSEKDNPIYLDVESSSDRDAYRVVPDPDNPVIIQLDGEICSVIDISAAGVSCRADHLQPNMRYGLKLSLPLQIHDIEAHVDVISVSDGIARCAFVNFDAEAKDMIHRYVLLRQKSAIKAIRASFFM